MFKKNVELPLQNFFSYSFGPRHSAFNSYALIKHCGVQYLNGYKTCLGEEVLNFDVKPLKTKKNQI
jgi:hypothetical protein